MSFTGSSRTLRIIGICTSQHSLSGTLRNHDGDANENVAWKHNFALLVLFRDYSNLFNLFSVAKLSSNGMGGNGVQVDIEKGSPQNLEFGYCLPEYGEEMYQNLKRMCRASVFSLNPIVLWRSLCRRRSGFLDSQIYFSLRWICASELRWPRRVDRSAIHSRNEHKRMLLN